MILLSKKSRNIQKRRRKFKCKNQRKFWQETYLTMFLSDIIPIRIWHFGLNSLDKFVNFVQSSCQLSSASKRQLDTNPNIKTIKAIRTIRSQYEIKEWKKLWRSANSFNEAQQPKWLIGQRSKYCISCIRFYRSTTRINKAVRG